MSTPLRLRWRRPLLAVALAVATACGGSDGGASALPDEDDGGQDPVASSDEGSPDVDEPAADLDEPAADAEEATSDPAVDGPLEGPLYVDDLHAGLAAGDPGTATLEVDGRTLTLDDVTCTYEAFSSGELIFAQATGDSDVGPLEVSVSRRLTDLDDGTDQHDVTLARLSDDEGQWADRAASATWLHTGRDGASFVLGGGEIPLVRAVEDTAISARGELAFLPMADGELSGPFGLVVTCP